MTLSQLKGLDWQILEALQQDGRMTVSELAKQLNRSRSSISEHIARLQDSGVLTGFSLVVDEEKLGYGINAFVRVQAESSQHRSVVESITDVPEVAECHVLAGTDLLMIRVVARDMPHLRALVDRFTFWGATTTDVIFSTVKQNLKINSALRKSIQERY